MGLAQPPAALRAPHILAIGDEAPGGQLLDRLGLDRRLELSVEALQRLLK